MKDGSIRELGYVPNQQAQHLKRQATNRICVILPRLGIPLNGQRAAYLRLALGAYLTGDRETLVPIMADKLRELDQDKIEALIHYYASGEQ